MKKTWIKNLSLSLILISTLSINFTGCSKGKDVVLGDAKKEEKMSKKQNLKVSEKKISIPKGYNVIGWKNDKEILITNLEEVLYSFNIENGEMKCINYRGILDGATLYTEWRPRSANKDGMVFLIKNFKLYIYDTNKNSANEVMDLNDAKKELETKYKIKNDNEFDDNLRIGCVDGNKDKLYIITHAQYEGYHKNRVRIVDVNTKNVIISEEYTDTYFINVLSYEDKYYVTSLFNKLYEGSVEGNNMKLNIATKKIGVANSKVFMTKNGRVMQGWDFRPNDGEFKFYNVTDKKDEKSFCFQDKDKLSSVMLVNYNEGNNIIVFTKSVKKPDKEKGHRESDFIGLVNENNIETFYKMNDYEEKEDTESWVDAEFNEKGDKMILTRRILDMKKNDQDKLVKIENIVIELKK